MGELSYEKIAKGTKLSVEEIEKLAGKEKRDNLQRQCGEILMNGFKVLKEKKRIIQMKRYIKNFVCI